MSKRITFNVPCKILYTNYKGLQAWRSIIPLGIEFVDNEWHSEEWCLRAYDKDKKAERSFAINEIEEVKYDQAP